MQRLNDLIEFYGIVYRIVKAWPATYSTADSQETRSARINTFGVVRSLSDFDADNLKKNTQYTTRELFFARSYHDSGHQPSELRVNYPALAIREDVFSMNDPLDYKGGKKKMFHNLVMILADQMPGEENNYIDPVSSRRTIEEVGNDLRIRMSQFLIALGQFAYVKGYLSGSLVFEGWHDTEYIKTLVDDGEIIDKFITEDKLLSYITNVSPANGEVFYNIGGDNLVICTLPLTVEASSCHSPVVFTYPSPVEEESKTEIFESKVG